MRIDTVYEMLEEAERYFESITVMLRAGGLDTKVPKSVFENVSLDMVGRMFVFASSTMHAIRPTDDSSPEALVVDSAFGNLNSLVADLRNHLRKVESRVKSFSPDGTTINDQNGNLSLQFLMGGTQTNQWDAAGNFGPAYNAIINLIATLGRLLPLVKGDGVADLTSRSSKLSEIVSAAERARVEAEKAAKAASDAASVSGVRVKTIQEIESKADASLNRIDAIQQQVTKDQAAVTTVVSSAEATAAKAASLEQQVLNYAAKFDAFQSQLDQRSAEMDQLVVAAKEAEDKNKGREAEIDRLIATSDGMVRGATNAGLSESLEKTRRRYEVRMYIAQVGFIFAAVALFICVLPIAASVVPGLFSAWFPSLTPVKLETDAEFFSEIAGKALLLLPATWLTYFCSKLQAQFFHLEREYGHKAALARSVDGFRRQADKFQEEIAMAVFLEIRANPAASPAPDPIEHPILAGGHSLLDWFKKRATGQGSATPPGGA